ncbi:hypothetical protein D3C81_2080200 [compost metagenome]
MVKALEARQIQADAGLLSGRARVASDITAVDAKAGLERSYQTAQYKLLGIFQNFWNVYQ